jgi:hypothetical protein
MRNSLEKFFNLVAQASQPVSKKQVGRAQPGKAVPPVKPAFHNLPEGQRHRRDCLKGHEPGRDTPVLTRFPGIIS